MTDGPTPEPNTFAPHDAAMPGPNAAYFAPPPSQSPMPSYPPPEQPWTNPNGPGWPGTGGLPPVGRPGGFGPAVAAAILGLLGCVVPILPIDMLDVRAFIAFPFAVPGLVLAIVGCSGRRRGQSLAAVGGILSAIALVVGAAMVIGHARNGLL